MLKRGFRFLALACLTAVFAVTAQTPAPAKAPAPAKPAAPPAAKPAPAAAKSAPPTAKPAAKPAAPAEPAWSVKSVLDLLSGGMSEDFIIGQVKQKKTAFSLTTEQMLAIKKAGGTERLITTMMDPSSTPAPAPAATPAPAAPEPAAAAPAPAHVAATPAAPPAPRKRKVAVYEFDYSTVRTAVQSVFKTDQDIGRGIQALLVKRLADMGDFTLLERGKIGNVMKEQDFGASGRVKQGTQARIGRIIGADAQIYGDIVVFGRDDKQRSIKGGGMIGGMLGGAMNAFKEDKANVTITFRVVDAETSEIIGQGEAKGESARKSKSWGGFIAGVGGAAAGVKVDMSSSNFAQTIIGEATIDAVNKLADQLKAQGPKIPQKQLAVEGRVADVSGAALTITVGSNDGVQTGDRFEVHRIIKEIVDPTTKEVLDLQTLKVGDLVLQTVRDRISVGVYTGQPGVANGYLVRKPI
jgi:curli biogenesis system outer membrane secretion channel CsgG